MPTIEVDAGTYDQLRRQAVERQLTVDELVAPALQHVAYRPAKNSTPHPNPSMAELDRLLDAMAAQLPDPPPEEITYSREDIYFDHD